MATRFRLPASGTAVVSPAVQSYTHTGSVRRKLLLSDTTTLATDLLAPDAADHIAAGDTLFAQFVSDPLKAQAFTSGDAFKFAVQCLEANAGNNLTIQIFMGIVNEAGTSAIGTIRSKVSEGTECATTLTNRFLSSTLSGTVNCSDGDRLVIEFSLVGTPVAAGGVQGHNGSIRFGGSGAGGDLAENDTDTGTTLNPWIEFANTIQFLDIPRPEQVPYPVKRKVSIAGIAMACAFVPVLEVAAAATPTGASGFAPAGAYAQGIQYQAVSAPITTDAVVVVAPDYFTPAYPDWLPRRPGLHASRQQAYTSDISRESGPVGGATPISIGSWRFRQYMGMAGPVFVPGEVAGFDPALVPLAPLPVVPARRLRPPSGSVGPVFIPDVTQPVTPNSWAPVYIDRYRKPLRSVALGWFTMPAYVPDVTQPVTANSWGPRYPDRLNPRPRTAWYQPYTQDKFGPPAEVIAPDLAEPVYPDKVYAPAPLRTATTWTAPLYVPDVTQPVTALSWTPDYPDRNPAKRRTVWFQPYTQDRFDPPGVVVAPDLAQPVYPDRVHARKPLRTATTWTAPLFVPDVTSPVTALSWKPTYPDRNPRRKPVVWHQFWTIDRFDPPGTVVAPDIAAPVYPFKVYARKPLRIHPSWTAPLYIPDVTVPVPPQWRPQYPVYIWRKYPTRTGFVIVDPVALTLPSATQPPLLSDDNFFIAVQTPLYIEARTDKLYFVAFPYTLYITGREEP